MKILVTGADGMIGSAIRKLNPADTVYVTRQDGDLTDFSHTKEIFNRIKPSHVIHLAAQVGGIGANATHPGEFFRNNLLMNVNVLESARLSEVKKLLSFMSTCIFPDKTEYPLNEKSLHDGPPHPSNFGYAYAKRMLDIQSRAYRKEYGCNYITALPANIYGPDDNYNLENAHVVAAQIHKCYLAKTGNTELVVWGSGSPLREFIYSEDIAKLALWAIENYSEDDPIIFSSGIENSIKELVETIAKKMEFSGELIFDSSKPDGQLRKPSDTTKLYKYLPDFKFTALEEGIESAVKWFVGKYPEVRK
jgi:GDP-L-fucose synthase